MPPQKVSSLQQLIEEGEDEHLEVGTLAEPLTGIQDNQQHKFQQQHQHQQQQQQQQQQQVPPPPQAQPSELDDGFVKEDEGEGLDYGVDEYEEPLPPLELEDSQELKRRIFPAEVVKVGNENHSE